MKKSDRVFLQTNFEEAECLRRLRDARDAERRKSTFRGKVDGVFGAQGFQLAYRANGNYQYAMPHLRGRLVQEAHGTRVEGQFTVSRLGTAFVWCLGAMSIAAGVFLFALAAQADALQLPVVWLLGLPFLLLGTLVLSMLRPIARRHRKKLSEFLENALMTQIQPRP